MTRSHHFDRSSIKLHEIAYRDNIITVGLVCPLVPPAHPFLFPPSLAPLLQAIRSARANHHPVILMIGGHLTKLGLSPYLIDLVERGWLSHIACNGSALIHDFELALVGGTSEDVAKWLPKGQFGLWRETGRLNDIIRHAAQQGEGIGQAVGRAIEADEFPHRDLSLAAACFRTGVPLTCHVTIGADVIHAHPNCDGAATGQASYTDFLIFARTIQDLEGGVFLNVGSAVTGPEVFLKALSMARNVAHQQGQHIRHFTTAVFDLAPLPDDWRTQQFSPEEAWYYYRPWKTLLCRAVSDGGSSHYIRGDFRDSIPALWQALVHPAAANPSSGSTENSPSTH